MGIICYRHSMLVPYHSGTSPIWRLQFHTYQYWSYEEAFHDLWIFFTLRFTAFFFNRWATRDIARLHIRSRTVQSVDKNRIKTSKINYGSTLIKKSLVSKSRKSQRNGRMTYCNDFSFSFNSCCNNWVKLKVFCTKFFFHEQGPASKVNK